MWEDRVEWVFHSLNSIITSFLLIKIPLSKNYRRSRVTLPCSGHTVGWFFFLNFSQLESLGPSRFTSLGPLSEAASLKPLAQALVLIPVSRILAIKASKGRSVVSDPAFVTFQLLWGQPLSCPVGRYFCQQKRANLLLNIWKGLTCWNVESFEWPWRKIIFS